MPVSCENHYEQKKSCKVFIVSEFVDATENSTGYYWSKIIGGLSKKFSNIYVISTKNSYGKVKAPSNLVTYIHINSIEYNKKDLISRLFGQACQTFFFSKAIIKNIGRGDVIFSGTNPTLLIIAISILKSFKGFKWVILVHDVFPENLVAAKLINNKSLFYRLLKGLFDRVYSSADTLIAIGRDMYDLLSMKTKMQCRIEYISNWVDLTDITPLKRNSKKLIFALDDNKIIFQFFGNLGRLQGIENLLKAILLVKNRKATFIFIGSGSDESLILDFIKNNPNKSIFHFSEIPFKRNNVALSSCDVAIVSLAEGMNGLGVPSKAYFSLAADKPLLFIGDKTSELSILMSEEPNCGWHCESGNPKKLALLIDQICNAINLAAPSSRRAIIAKKYNYKKAIEKYSKLISDLIN